jgi:hypothetical protein
MLNLKKFAADNRDKGCFTLMSCKECHVPLGFLYFQWSGPAHAFDLSIKPKPEFIHSIVE